MSHWSEVIKLTYCSQLCRPHLLSDITMIIEKVQRLATRFILHDYTSSSYMDRLVKLNLLPTCYWLELQDILFLIKCIQHSSDNFNIHNHGDLAFSSLPARSGSSNKLPCTWLIAYSLDQANYNIHSPLSRVFLVQNIHFLLSQ